MIGGVGTVRYRANSAGAIVIRASQSSDASSHFRAASPVDLILQVVGDAGRAPKPCAILPPPPPSVSASLDVASIVSLMGNPTPFLLSAQGPNTIAIYSTREPLSANESKILASFRNEISVLVGHTAASLGITPSKPFTLELAIPHAAALGDLSTRVNGLNYNQFTVQNVGTDKVRVTALSQPDCDTWTGFLSDIRRTAWQLLADPMNKKLFYLSSSDVATAFSGLAPASPSPSASSPAPSASGQSSSSTAAGAPATNAVISVAQPPGSNVLIHSDTTPCVVAGLAFGSSNACASAATPSTASGSSANAASAASSASSAPKASLGMASVAVAMGTGEQSPPDLLIFSDTNPGDDAQVEERLRVLTQLDLPRPEMIINAWVTQNSSTSAQAMGGFTNLVNGIVADYNREFQNVVLRGWTSVHKQSQEPAYWHEAFRSYVEDRFIGEPSARKPGNSPQEMAQAFLDNSQATLAQPLINDDEIRGPWICPPKSYCLGYTALFHPPKPTLTDLLLAIIAARNPLQVFDIAIASIEKGSDGEIASDEVLSFAQDETQRFHGITSTICEDKGHPEARSRCRAIWNSLDLDHVTAAPFQRRTCADMDLRGALYSLMQYPAHQPRIHLYCLQEEVHRILQTSKTDGKVYGAGLLRATVADFLYNYKISQQYPHEFTSYDLTRSADALNNALNPFIDAFNRDLSNYQLFVRADMEYHVERLNSRNDERCCVKRLFGLDKPSFFNDGLVTVRTISGQTTTVNTASQSFLNVSTAPQLSALLSSIAGSNKSAPAPAPSPSPTPAPSIPAIGALGEISMIAQVLANYQTTSAQIGRGLNLTATPRSLTTASSAEISVSLNADESASPSLYSVGPTNDPTLLTSRVATHDTTTRVRIDSVKLFEVSSLTAILQRSRSRFPLLPPFVEIPYIGTIAGIPLGAAKEFHNSTAILSAYVVPTAADIAYGLRFVSDLIVDGLNQGQCAFYKGADGPDVPDVCLFRKALSLADFDAGHGQLNNFNRAMVRCFEKDLPSVQCHHISFDDVPRMYQK
jgi:hypothetical protein